MTSTRDAMSTDSAIFFLIVLIFCPPRPAKIPQDADLPDKHDSARQGPHPGAKDLVHLDDYIVKPIKLEPGRHWALPELRIEQKDSTWPVAVDFRDHIGQRFLSEHQIPVLPRRDDGGIDRPERARLAAAVRYLLHLRQADQAVTVLHTYDAFEAGNGRDGLIAANIENRRFRRRDAVGRDHLHRSVAT